MLRRILAQLSTLLRRDRFEQELEEEIQFHLEMRARDNLAAGMSPSEAQRQARISFGNVTATREESRTPWWVSRLDELCQDGGYAVRWLAHHPAFTGAVVLTLALGIGANSAVFSLLDALLLQSPAVERPEEVYFVGDRDGSGVFGGSGRHTSLLSVPMFHALQERSEAFADVAALCSYKSGVYRPGELGPERLEARLVSGNFFHTLGVGAHLGRVFAPTDDDEGAAPVMVLSHSAWRGKFAADPEIVGKRITASEIQFTVVGVAPPGFYGAIHGEENDVWIPLIQHPEVLRDESRTDRPDLGWLRVVARARPGVTLEAGQEELTRLFRQQALDEWGGSPPLEVELEQLSLTLRPIARGPSRLRGTYARPVTLLMAVVGIVLLIACANVANLLLARASARGDELATRVALGAGRGRLVRQLLTEGSLLAFLGGGLGLLFASFGVRSLLALVSDGASEVYLDVGIDLRLVAFTLAVSLATVLLFGLAPALRASGAGLANAVRQRGVRTSRPTLRSLGSWLVITQVALCLTLLIAAGLFLRSLDNLRRIDSGLDAESVLFVQIDPAGGGYEIDELPALYRHLIEEARALPEVRDASLSTYGLFTGFTWRTRAFPEGVEMEHDELMVHADLIEGDYFATLGLPLLRGRRFTSADRAESPTVAIVSKAFADHFFGGADPVGRRFGFQNWENSGDVEIVGMVADAKYHDLREDPTPMIYIPAAQEQSYLESLSVRTVADPGRVAEQLRTTLSAAEPSLPVLDMRTLPSQIDRTLARERLVGRLSTLFGLVALVLAALGLYAVLAYSVARRVREIGLRIALGARRSEIVALVLRDALKLVAVGVALGLPVALALGRFATSLLYELRPFDPVTLLAAAAVLVSAGLVSSYFPARRAAALDPVEALRCE